MTAARPDTWMPMFWGDYARDTGHLNAAGHGAYLMLIKHYWCTGKPLADDDDELWRIACCDSKRDWLKLRPKIARLFQVADGEWRHKRIKIELKRALENVEKRASAGRKGAESRWQSDGNANSNRMANAPECQWQNDGTSSSPSAVSEVKSSEANASGAAAPLVVVDADWLYGDGLSWLSGKAVKDQNARSIIGRWRKLHGDDATRRAIQAAMAEDPMEPVAWITAALQTRQRQRDGPPGVRVAI